MSVVVKRPDKKVVMYTKGADSMMYLRLRSGDEEIKEKTRQDLEAFSTEGLRTLVLARRIFTKVLILCGV
jgi:phospholipid-translocating ATPase